MCPVNPNHTHTHTRARARDRTSSLCSHPVKLVDSGDTGEVDEKEFGNMFTGKTLREVIEEAVNAGASLSDQWSTTAPTTVHIVDFGNRHGEIEAHKDAAVDQATHIIQGANAFTGGDVPRRWVDVRGWNSAISEVLQQKYDVPNGILFDSRVRARSGLAWPRVAS